MGKLFAEFLLQFRFGKADTLATALHSAAHGSQIILLAQDGLAPAPWLDRKTRKSVFLVALEPGVDHDLTTADLFCDFLGAQVLAVHRLAFEQDHLAALAVLVRFALPPGFFPGGVFLVGQEDAFDLCHKTILTYF